MVSMYSPKQNWLHNDLNLLSILFSDLGEIFCRFVNKLTLSVAPIFVAEIEGLLEYGTQMLTGSPKIL